MMPKTERLASAVFWGVIILGAIQLADAFFGLTPYDATDNGRIRSGLALRTDVGTGCEYLVTPAGGITPRLDATGKQTGCRP